MVRPTRREALVSIAVGISGQSLPGQDAPGPRTFSASDYDLLGILTDLILPPSDTPGARAAGVPLILDEELAGAGETLDVLRAGFARLRAAGFEAMSEPERVAALTRASESPGADQDFFETLKGLTIDAYYSTEAGLVEELGYQGNTYLADFPGCAHDHELEDLG